MMEKQYSRRDFMRMAALTGTGLFLSACGIESDDPKKKGNGYDTSVSKVNGAVVTTSEHVLFYKKGDEEYEALRQGFNKRVERYPAVIALCKNTQGVAEAVKYARKNNLPIAVKSGGHCFEGFSSNDGGLVINLSLMNKVEWIDDEHITVGPGCKLSELYDELLPKQRLVPSGSCGSVGLGGLALGGGYGLFAREYGLTCDSLLALTMVDGNGEIRYSKDDESLLWACKGGGNGNFGIITEMAFQTHMAPATIQSHHFKAYRLDAEKATAILEKWFEVMGNLPTSCFSAFVLNGTTLTVLLTNFNAHSDEVQKAIDLFSPVADKTTIGNPKALAGALKNYYGIQHPIFFKNASAGFYKGFDDIKGCIANVCEVVTTTPGMIYQINTLGGHIDTPEFEAASAYPHRAYPFLSELQTYWDSPKRGEQLMDAFQSVQAIFADHGISTQYRNYPDIHFKNWEALYYGDNYQKLQSVKSKYDPDNIIRSGQSIKV